MSETEQMMAWLHRLNYPAGMGKIAGEIKGRGFFPGCRGLWLDDDETVSNKSIMIVGHDFGAKADFERSVKRGHENFGSQFWRNLEQMLHCFEIDPALCFFTNGIMGVRLPYSTGERVKATGVSPAYQYPAFIEECRQLLIDQIRLQRPRLIIVFGLHILKLISQLSGRLRYLAAVKNYKMLDEHTTPLSGISNVDIDGIPDFTVSLALIMHPTYWPVTVKHREIYGLRGAAAEKELINRLWRLV